KPLAFWDRIKFLLLLGLVWLVLVWSSMANDPILPFGDAVRNEVTAGLWGLVLMGLGVVRQVHFLISEHRERERRIGVHSVFGGVERMTHRRLSDWTRFRIRRLLMWAFWIVILALIIGKIRQEDPVLAVVGLPALIWSAAPLLFQVLAGVVFVVIQFAALFWF